MLIHFRAPDGGFFDTGDDHETLILRPSELQDNALPSGNSMAADILLRLAGLAVEPRYTDLAWADLAVARSLPARYPLGFGHWLTVLTYALAHPPEIAIIGDPTAPDTRALLDTCATGYRPHQILAVGLTAPPPLLQDREQLDGQATAYVCVDSTCRPPVTDPLALHRLLEEDKST